MANNYTLGRGELHFAKFLPGIATPGGERYIGNTPQFSATIENENLDHYNSDHGVREKDESIALQTDRNASFTTDNIHPDNLALFFFGSKINLAVTGATVTGEEILNLEKGLHYQLGRTEANPVGARALDVTTAPIVKDKTTPATIYVAGTDYEINPDLGRITILEGGSIPANGGITVDYTTKTSTRSRVISGSKPIEGALHYIADNPAGENFDWYMPWVKLTPNGDFELKGDEWQTIPFNVEILKQSGKEAIYVDGRPLSA